MNNQAVFNIVCAALLLIMLQLAVYLLRKARSDLRMLVYHPACFALAASLLAWPLDQPS